MTLPVPVHRNGNRGWASQLYILSVSEAGQIDPAPWHARGGSRSLPSLWGVYSRSEVAFVSGCGKVNEV